MKRATAGFSLLDLAVDGAFDHPFTLIVFLVLAGKGEELIRVLRALRGALTGP